MTLKMAIIKATPVVIAIYVSMVGFLYCTTALGIAPLFQANQPGASNLLEVSAIFLILGVYYTIQVFRGGLKRRGKTLLEVRLEAVGKLNSPELLLRTAEEDTEPAVREKARERLDELTSSQ